jgi:excisionase family DNA binding protein
MDYLRHDPTKITYSIKQACNASSLSRSTLWRHVSAGRLKAVRVGRRTLILADSLRSLLAGEG